MTTGVGCSRIGCEGKEVVRVNRTSGEEFYGCDTYPKCKVTRKVEQVKDWEKGWVTHEDEDDTLT